MNSHRSSANPAADVPVDAGLPQHVAVIMDGNGRWATQRHLPRIAGHSKGVERVRGLVRACGDKSISFLTLFAFSSENWRRPKREVGSLIELFINALDEEITKLHQNFTFDRPVPMPNSIAGKLSMGVGGVNSCVISRPWGKESE